MVTIKGKYEIADLKAAQNLHGRMGRFGRISLYFMIGMMILVMLGGIWLVTQGTSSGWSLVIYPLAVGALIAAYWFGLRPYQITRMYNQQKDLSSPFEIELTEEGYNINNSYGSGRMPWKDFVKWKADEKIFLLYRNDTMFNMIPRRLLQDETDVMYLLNQLRDNNVKDAQQVRNPAVSIMRIVSYIILAAVVGISIYLNTAAHLDLCNPDQMKI